MELWKSFTIIKTPPNYHLILNHRSIKTPISLSATPESTHRVSLSETLHNETLKTLEWPSVCKQVSSFTSTTMGFAAAQGGRLRLGRSLEESRKLLDQTTAAMALPQQLDFTGIEDVSEIVNSSVSGELVTIGELCAVKRTLKSARTLYEQLKEASLNGDCYESLVLELKIFDLLTDFQAYKLKNACKMSYEHFPFRKWMFKTLPKSF